MRTLIAFLLLMLGCPACQSPSGTFVVLSLDTDTPDRTDVTAIELVVMVGPRSATTTFQHDIRWPSSATLEIVNGEGALDIVGTARNAAGDAVASAHATDVVHHGQTSRVTLQFSGAPIGSTPDLAPPPDGSADLGSPNLALDPTSTSFNSVPQGTVGPDQIFTVTNQGTATATPFSTTLSGTDAADFAVGSNGCGGLSLAPAATCTIAVHFQPRTTGTPGARSATLQVGTLGAALSGTAVAPGTTVPLTVTFHSLLGRGGRITGGGLDCNQTCTSAVAQGSTVTLTAVADTNAIFAGWSAPCSGVGSCQITLDIAHSVTATFRPLENFVFATSKAYAGNTTPAQADAACQSLANAANLPGTYVSWLSTSTTAASARLQRPAGGTARGWLRVDGKPFADSVTTLTSGQVFYPILLDETGVALTNPIVFTGTNPDGKLATNYTCADWTSASAANYGLGGSAFGGSQDWTDPNAVACNLALPRYCFGVDYAQPLVPTRTLGRRAFVSAGNFDRKSGLAGADALCASEASAAGLSGSYKAFLSTTSASASSRFDLTKPLWVRTDGIPIAANLNDFLSTAGPHLTAISVEADGTTYRGDFSVVLGSDSPTVVGRVDSTCNNWSSDVSTSSMIYGRESRTDDWWPGNATGCDFGFIGLYCFEE